MKQRQDGKLRYRARRWVRRLEHAVLWPLGFTATLALFTALVLGLIDELEVQQTAIVRSARVEREMEQMLELTVDVETAMRAYAISHDPAFLEPARRALPRIDAGLDSLRALTAGSPAVAEAVRALEATVRQRVGHAQALHANTADGKPLRAERMVEARQLQDRTRAVVEQVGAQEGALRQQSAARSARVRLDLKAVIALSTLVLGALGWMWFRERRRLQRTQDNYRSLFAGAANGIALVDADGHIVQANASYAGMLGYAQSELVGEDFTWLKHPDERQHAREALRVLLGSDQKVLRNERRYLRRDGTVVWVRSTMSSSRETADGSPQVLVIAEDVSERIRHEELLRRSAVLLQNAGRMAAIDGWFLALPSGALHIGAHLKKLLRLDDDRPVALLARLGARSRRVLLRALAGCRRTQRPFDIELEAHGASAPVVLRVMGQPAQGPHGLSGIDGAVQDITEQKRIQRRLGKSELRFRAAAQVTNDGIWDWDIAAGTIWRSPSIAALVGLDTRELDDSPAAWQHLIHPDDRAAVRASSERVLRGTADEFQAEYRVRRTDGSYIYVLDKACALHDDSGEVVRMIGGIRDLTERRRSQQALMGMAASVPNGDSDTFLRTLLTHMQAAIGADGGAIARPDESGRMRTLAAVVDGKPLGALHYELAGSPCAQLVSLGEYIVPDGLAAVCPDAAGLPGLQARAYAGRHLVAADGRLLGVIFALFREPIGDPDVLTAVLRVFAARAGAELERMDGAARMREQAALLDRAREAIVVLGLDLDVKFWNRGAELMYGITSQQSLGGTVLSCYEEELAARAALAAVLENGEWRGDSVQRGRDGGVLTVDESWTLVLDDQGAPHSILKVGSDVTEKRADEEQIRRLAYYDTLTGLPNRRLLMDRLKQLILRNERHGRHGALLFIDMDNFKSLNDTHGHEAGDEFLRQTAARLRACVRADDTVARLGGDEFVILLDSLDAEADSAAQQARAIGASIVNAFRQPVRIGTVEHSSTASVGVVLMREAHDGVDALLRQADQAMYQAKNGGRNAVVLAQDAEQAHAAPAAADLILALAAGEFELWLQPEADAAGMPAGAFASVRWRRGPGHLVDGKEFISLAERCGVMPELETWTLRRCAGVLSRWQRSPALAAHRLTLALTPQQLRDPRFGERVLDLLAAHGCAAAGLTLEVPAAGIEGAAAAANIAVLRAVGVRVSIADFGLDLAAPGCLRGMVVDGVRLASSLVSSCATGAVEGAAVRAILGLARELDLAVAAAGVDDAAQQAVLVGAGCRSLRGRLYGPARPDVPPTGQPVPADAPACAGMPS
jgi:diguanylate cyclase (GGDEF)-like protein/PAS domain S-box-containing protein